MDHDRSPLLLHLQDATPAALTKIAEEGQFGSWVGSSKGFRRRRVGVVRQESKLSQGTLRELEARGALCEVSFEARTDQADVVEEC